MPKRATKPKKKRGSGHDKLVEAEMARQRKARRRKGKK